MRGAHQRAGYRQHLLLAAGEIGAPAAPPLFEAREDVPGSSSGQRALRRHPGEHQVFLDIEAAEDAPVLGHQLQAERGDRIGAAMGSLAVEA